MKVLIVDDEDPLLQFVNRVLTRAGYATVTASNGVEALKLAASIDPLDMLVTDLMMPEMGGDELARRLRRNHAALKVLYFTGYCDRLFDEKRTLWEGEAFIEKPCSQKALLEAVSLLRTGRIVDPHLDRSGASSGVKGSEAAAAVPSPLR